MDWQDEKFENLSQEIGVLSQQVSLLRESVAAIGNSPSPYDDYDLQLEDLKNFIDERTRRSRMTENCFFGLVILMLLINLAMLCWISLSA